MCRLRLISALFMVVGLAPRAFAREVEVVAEHQVELTGRVVLDGDGRARDAQRRPMQSVAAGAMVHVEGPLWLGARLTYTRVTPLNRPRRLRADALVLGVSLGVRFP